MDVINKVKLAHLKHMMVLGCLFILFSCVPDPRSGGRFSEGASVSNSNLATGYGRILEDNPIILTDNKNLTADVNLNKLLSKKQYFITTDQFLNGSCPNVSNCYSVKQDQTSLPLQNVTSKWGYEASSLEFIEVNTFAHIKLITDKFQAHLGKWSTAADSVIDYSFSTPTSFNLSTTMANWKGGNGLVAYSNCDVFDNAFYSPGTFTLCFGTDSVSSKVKFAQDSTVVYHEVGHTFQDIMINLRNVAAGITPKSTLGNLFYDEAGSIGEGVSDYFSYYMNKRTHFGEWALGRFNKQGRPMREDDDLHAPGISLDNNERLSYPQYLNYDPNFPTIPYEDIHYAGQIISHFLVALSDDLVSVCKFSHEKAVEHVAFFLTETLAYKGDLTTRGKNGSAIGRVNLNTTFATEWLKKSNPLNFRSFAQIMASNMRDYLSDPNMSVCNGGVYPQDRIEQLFDLYGLLLFEKYNEDGSLGTTSTSVSSLNRKKSVLINKSLLKLDPRTGASKAFIFDDRASMIAALRSLQANGQAPDISDQIEDDLPYNNGNAQISPGEFVGLSLNMFNDSNSDMAGIEILANDWDHVSSENDLNRAPCNNLGDGWPSTSEGAAPSTGDCATVTDNNGLDGDVVGPACFMQYADETSTRWVSQDEYRSLRGDEPNICLGGSTSTKDCYFRVVSGADHAIFSKIAPKKTWAETLTADGVVPVFNYSNILFFEVSEWIPPGTSFRCRFRARFTNCKDCWHDSTTGDDYLDKDYSGAAPYKIIPFEFTVIN